MIGIILVSHSKKITDGTKELIEQMANDNSVSVISAGGTSDGRLGASSSKILDAIETLKDAENILIFTDMGSSTMSSEAAVEMVDDEVQEKIKVVQAPIVEGAFAAAIKASTNCSLDEILSEIELSKI